MIATSIWALALYARFASGAQVIDPPFDRKLCEQVGKPMRVSAEFHLCFKIEDRR